jgi:tRNA dimethylallyltransferase
MKQAPSKTPLIAVVGPTASGKSDLGVALAERFDGEIVNCDSVQVYRYFDIGTAKTPERERRGIPHHLLDIADPCQTFTAGDYARRARSALGEIRGRGRLPVIVGGTGFYLHALLEGLFEGPERDERLRRRLLRIERGRPGALHRLLERRDPKSAARIHRHDANKIVRALEIVVKKRRPLQEAFAAGRDPLTGFRRLGVGLNPPRAALHRRIEQRSRRMFENGLVEEVRAILARGFSPACKPFESLGYAQALRVVRGETTLDQAIEETQVHTRQYAKRQWTWFRRQETLEWFDGFGDDPEIQQAVATHIHRRLI